MAKPHDSRDQEVFQEHPMVKELLAELQEIDDRRQGEARFHELMGQRSHIGMPVQYERLFFRSPGGKEEKKHNHRRGTQQSRRRGIPHQRV